jgi:hypothetical protein
VNIEYQAEENMKLIREYIAPENDAPVLVLFGGNPERMNEVVSLIRDSIPSVTTIGNFSEEEGLLRLITLKKLDLVLIGGRYSEEQRIRIRNFLKLHFPKVSTTEPGYQYPYGNREILQDIRKKLRIEL